MSPTVLAMELRSLDVDSRTVVGRCIPYDETSYLVPNPSGERIRRGAFNKSIAQRGDRIFLNLEHDERAVVGRARSFADEADGLVGTFDIRRSTLGDQTLAELAEGYWPALSVAFRSLQRARGADGAVEICEGYLGNVALVHTPAYEGAEVLSVRTADVSEIMAGFGPRPEIDLTPIPPLW